MLDPQAAPGTPDWWATRLLTRLADTGPHYDWLESYVENTNVIPIHAGKSVKEAYRRLMGMARMNFAELLVEAVRERMVPTGFRTGAVSDLTGDAEAWRIWQGNSLDADHAQVSRASLTMGMSYVIVGQVDPDTGVPLITPEDPREVVAEVDPRNRRRVKAAVKVFRDDEAGADRLYLYLPGGVLRAVREPTSEVVGATIEGWEWSGEDALPVAQVPVVPFPNNPRIGGSPVGEFERHVSVLDRINYTVLSRLEVATLQAFRQRAVKGVPSHDEDGEEIDYDDIFSADPGALWVVPDTAEFWESGQVDLGPIRMAIRDDVQDLAAATRTPLFYLTPEATNGSAEGAALAREGLVFKTTDRIRQAGEAWEQVMALAFAFAGDTIRASRPDMETIWASPERFSLAERYDAASKAEAAGVPWRTRMSSILQFSPQEIERMETERAVDALLAPQLPTPAVTGG